MDQFKIIRRIGSGSFGVALLVQKNGLENNKQFVIKQINLSGMTQKEIQEARHEVAVLQTPSGGIVLYILRSLFGRKRLT